MELVLLFGILLVLVLLGVPIAISIGMAGLIVVLVADLDVPLALVPREMFSGINSWGLMAIPFFILAGELMNSGGLTRRILEFADASVGWIRASMARVNVMASMLFAGVSGSGAADTAALGTTLIPAMAEKGYSKEFAAAITVASATVGPIIPPSVLFVIYGFLTGTSIGDLFVGGAVPGLLMGGALFIVSGIVARRYGYQQERGQLEIRRLGRAALSGSPALLVPAVIVGAILTGAATATEAGVVAVGIALVLGFLLFREIRTRSETMAVITRSLHSSAVVMFIIAASGLFANVLTRLRFQRELLDFLDAIATSPTQMLLLIVASVLVLGVFIDVTPLLIMFAAPMAAVGEAIGYDPVFFGVVIVMSATLGAITPPVGGFLLIAAGVGNVQVLAIVRPLIPFFMTLLVCLGLIIAFPQLVLWLPGLTS